MNKEDRTTKFVKKIINLFHMKLDKKTENLLIQIFKFVIVGGIATLIDFILLFVFKEVVHLQVIISNTLSFCISLIYNYIASVRWVFDVNRDKDPKKNFLIFLIFSIIGLAINDLIMYLLINKLSTFISKIIATAIVMVFNFITRKMFLE